VDGTITAWSDLSIELALTLMVGLNRRQGLASIASPKIAGVRNLFRVAA